MTNGIAITPKMFRKFNYTLEDKQYKSYTSTEFLQIGAKLGNNLDQLEQEKNLQLIFWNFTPFSRLKEGNPSFLS